MGLWNKLFQRESNVAEPDGRGPNERDEAGRTPLHDAASQGDLKQIKSLLGRGAHPLYEDLRGVKPLDLAEKGSPEAAAMIEGMGPFLHVATDRGNVAEVRALLKNGAPVDYRDLDGNTPLIKAVGHGDEALVQTLLDQAQPRLEARNYHGETAILTAAVHNHSDIAKALLAKSHGEDVNITDELGRTSLIEAVRENNVEVTRALLEAGADPNVKNLAGESATHVAARSRNPNLIDELVNHGADLYLRNDQGLTPREIAQAQGFPSVERLIEDYELRAFLGVEGRRDQQPKVRVTERELGQALAADLRPFVEQDLEGRKLEVSDHPEGRFHVGRTSDGELVTLHQSQDGLWQFSVSSGQTRIEGNTIDYLEQVRGMARHDAVWELNEANDSHDRMIKRDHVHGLPGQSELRMPGTAPNPPEPEISL